MTKEQVLQITEDEPELPNPMLDNLYEMVKDLTRKEDMYER